MSENLLKSLEVESDRLRESTIMRHLTTLSPEIQLYYEKMLAISLDYFLKISEDKMELLNMKIRDKAVRLSDQEEAEHSNIQLIEHYLKDNFEGKKELTIEEATILLSQDKLNSFRVQYMNKHMENIDYLNIYKAHSKHKPNLNNMDMKIDEELKKKLTEDVLKEYKNHLPWDDDELEHFHDEPNIDKYKIWDESDM